MLTLVLGLTEAQGQEAPDVLLPYVPAADSQVVIDGMIGDTEYVYSYEDVASGIIVYMEHDMTNVSMALVSPDTGWVGVGFAPPDGRMQQGNLIIAMVDGEGDHIFDGMADGYGFKPDVEGNGSDNIIEFAGVEANGKTLFEFRYPLVTGDPVDLVLAPNGSYAFFVSYAKVDDYGTQHIIHSPVLGLYVMEEVTPGTTLDFQSGTLSTTTGQPTPLTVSVVYNGSAMNSGQVIFYRVTSFGKLELGQAAIQFGEAVFYYDPRIAGTLTIIAELPSRIPGYFGSRDELTLTVSGEDIDPLEYDANSAIGQTWKNRYVFTILVIVGSVWLVILSALRLVILLPVVDEMDGGQDQGADSFEASSTPEEGPTRAADGAPAEAPRIADEAGGGAE